jgi:hypothetical protein
LFKVVLLISLENLFSNPKTDLERGLSDIPHQPGALTHNGKVLRLSAETNNMSNVIIA